MSREQLQYLIQLLDLAIASFEYKGERQLKVIIELMQVDMLRS